MLKLMDMPTYPQELRKKLFYLQTFFDEIYRADLIIMLEAILGAVVGAIAAGLISYYLPKIVKHFKRPLVYNFEFFPIRIASLFQPKINMAEKSIKILYENFKTHIINNPRELEGLEKINESLQQFIRNLIWLYRTDFIMKIVLLNRSTRNLKDISVSFDFLHQLTGYEFHWEENHEVERPPKLFTRDKIQSIKTIKILKPDSPLKIFVWGVVLEELKEKYNKEEFTKIVKDHVFVSYMGNNKGMRVKKIKI